MLTIALLFARGFGIVAFTAANVVFISSRRYGWAFATGFAISALWYSNVGEVARVPTGALWYGLGAACGTVIGAWLAGWLARSHGRGKA